MLLIAFTVAIATLVMGWFSSFARTTTATVSNSTSQAVNCADARVSIRDVYLQSAGGTGSANVIVENTGGSSVGITGLQLFNTSGSSFSTGFTAVGSINESQVLTFTITSATFSSCPGSFSQAVLTTSCGGIGDTFTNTPKCG